VCTGGEPLLQLDSALVRSFHESGFEVAIETNGTCAAPDNIDWICVSPKGDAQLALKSGHELKLLFPQKNAMPETFESLEFQYFFLQPIDGPDLDNHTARAVEYCLNHPQWRLSLQTHKLIDIR
jgi:organic radical activating enzyme